MKTKVIYIDVDDTIVRSVGTKRIPMPNVVNHIKKLHEQGNSLYLWSSGGANYCRDTATELGIGHCFIGFLPKPEIYVDDQPVSNWHFCRHLYPTQADDA